MSTTYSNELIFYVNGKLIIEKNVSPNMTLLHYLRYNLNLTGSKLGCGEGGCGACTVSISKYDIKLKKVVHMSVNACLAPLASIDHCHIITIEGLGNKEIGYHAVQSRIADFHGSQCGFCTPGIVMALYTYLKNNPNATKHELEESMDGNLCRCTGYRPLNDAIKSFASDNKIPYNNKDISFQSAISVDLTQVDANLHEMYRNARKNIQDKVKIIVSDSLSKVQLYNNYQLNYDLNIKSLQFPESLKQVSDRPLKFTNEQVTWYKPTTFQQLLMLKQRYPTSTLINGNTEVGIDTRFKKIPCPIRISSADIIELKEIEITKDYITFGSSVTLTTIQETYQQIINNNSYQTHHKRTALAFLSQIKWFSSRQIRNVCTIGGNIVNASPISDLSPLLQAINATLCIYSLKDGVRYININDFFINYKSVAMKSNEILKSITIPFGTKDSYLQSYKQARRRDDDIAIVTCGFNVILDDNKIIQDIKLSYGGMWKTCTRAYKTEKFLLHKKWTLKLLNDAYSYLKQDFNLKFGTPGGMEKYRMTLAASFLFKYFIFVAKESNAFIIDDKLLSIALPYQRNLSYGKQIYQIPKNRKQQVGRGRKHLAARAQSAGEAKYTGDIPDPINCLHGAIVGSKIAHGRIKAIDASIALGIDGVIAFYDHKSVPNNQVGDVIKDEWVFVPEKVQHVGEPIGIIIAKDRLTAEFAAHLVEIQYEELPAIFTIDEAIEKESYHNVFGHTSHSISNGNLIEQFNTSDIILNGEAYVGGQEHFYLETHNALVIPNENNDIQIYSSTQNPSVTQQEIAHILNIDANKVTCTVKRLGGGFGGKETRSVNIASYAAVAAKKLLKPVRICLERDIDMSITGQRHPFKAIYKVGFNKTGRLKALDIQLYNNAGYSLDLSMAVMDRALFHIDNVYKWPALRCIGRTCKTNLPSNTAFRGFGGPQGMMFTEMIIERIALYLNKDINEIKELNFYKEGDLVHFKQKLNNWTLPETWYRLKIQSNYHEKVQMIKKFNSQHRYKKRGIATTATKFGISFTYLPLNQGGALVNIYKDGSVLISHGGTEMGQGLHTKMAQVAADAFNISIDLIHINNTDTSKVPNTSASAASFSSDINGIAILDACNKIKKRLSSLLQDNKHKTWYEIITQAYNDRISLSATGYCKIDGIGYDFITGQGIPFRYFTNGTAVSVVEIDCLTGDFTTLSTDIVMDLGTSLNPIIDIGQIEGAFIQGMGWCTLEEMVWGDKSHPWIKPGYLMSKGPGNYKLPAFNDTPLDFNIHLLRDRPNPVTLHSSKAVGEPPFFLAASVFFAIKNAIQAARAENNLYGYFQLNAPATCERIRMACNDHITKLILSDTNHSNDEFYQTKGSY